MDEHERSCRDLGDRCRDRGCRADPDGRTAPHEGGRDGWSLVIDITGEQINPVPNLANAAHSREAFVTLSATALATGSGPPIEDSAPSVAYDARGVGTGTNADDEPLQAIPPGPT